MKLEGAEIGAGRDYGRVIWVVDRHHNSEAAGIIFFCGKKCMDTNWRNLSRNPTRNLVRYLRRDLAVS